MILRRLFLTAAAAALAGSLLLPAAADQVFQNVSTGKLPAPAATYNPNNLSIDYVYYPCGNGTSNQRFNPFNAQDHNGPITPPRGGGERNRRQPDPCRYLSPRQPPHRPVRGPAPPGPGRVIPLATPRS
jgi:hypothetical protein